MGSDSPGKSHPWTPHRAYINRSRKWTIEFTIKATHAIKRVLDNCSFFSPDRLHADHIHWAGHYTGSAPAAIFSYRFDHVVLLKSAEQIFCSIFCLRPKLRSFSRFFKIEPPLPMRIVSLREILAVMGAPTFLPQEGGFKNH